MTFIYLNEYLKKYLWDKMESEHVLDCCECGACQYACPSNLPILDYIRVGKNEIAKIMRERKK